MSKRTQRWRGTVVSNVLFTTTWC